VVAIWAITRLILLQRYLAARYQYPHDYSEVLMVFLIQATQNRDTLALQIELSELILALEALFCFLGPAKKKLRAAVGASAGASPVPSGICGAL
jgi:Low affinity iron permease